MGKKCKMISDLYIALGLLSIVGLIGVFVTRTAWPLLIVLIGWIVLILAIMFKKPRPFFYNNAESCIQVYSEEPPWTLIHQPWDDQHFIDNERFDDVGGLHSSTTIPIPIYSRGRTPQTEQGLDLNNNHHDSSFLSSGSRNQFHRPSPVSTSLLSSSILLNRNYFGNFPFSEDFIRTPTPPGYPPLSVMLGSIDF